jgi:hypothetical protein
VPPAGRIFIIDEVTPHPGMAEEFLRLYMERYAPGARSRGMQLEHTWVSPPVWLRHHTNTLSIVWSVEGAREVWATFIAGRLNESLVSWWWMDAAALVQTRTRRIMSEAGRIAELNDV